MVLVMYYAYIQSSDLSMVFFSKRGIHPIVFLRNKVVFFNGFELLSEQSGEFFSQCYFSSVFVIFLKVFRFEIDNIVL